MAWNRWNLHQTPFLIHKIVKLKRGTADIQLRCHRGVWKPLNIIGGSCHKYHFLLWQKFCRDKHVFVATKHVFCRDKIFCVDKTFVVTNICHNKHNFVVTKVLSWRTWFFFCNKRHVFVATKVCLLWQNFCCNKIMFFATKLCLSQQKWYLWQLPLMIPQDP